MNEVGIGLLGFGTVGAGVVDGLARNGHLIEERTGVRLVLRAVADPDHVKDRGVTLDRALLSPDSDAVVRDPRCEVVVETIGGTKDARRLVLLALSLGKPVVTANKALLAEHGAELFDMARRYKTGIFFEASVGGGIPVIRAIQEGLVANEFESLVGILNGTCNYILTQMEETGITFDEALAEAQSKGYAEANPALDIDGHDTAHKACILASLAYGRAVTPSQLRYRGIRGLDRNDIICAAELGYRIKMLASIRRVRDHAEVVVQPALVSATHMLAGIGGVYNAVMVNGDLTGRTLYYGRGAGRYPTGAAILGDLADAASRLRSSGPWNTSGFVSGEGRVRIQDPDAIMSRRYLRLTLADRPGILSCVTRMLSDQNISLAAVLQRESEMDGETPVILLTHPAPGRAFKTALKEIKELDGVLSPAVTFRIEDTGQGSAG